MRTLIGRAVTLFLALVFVLTAQLPVTAAGTTSVVSGVVRSADGAAIAGADVDLIGPTRMTQKSDAAGRFTFPDVPTGFYALQVSKAGFQTYRNDSVAAFIGETVTVNVTLAASSFSSLKTIASVSTNAAGEAQINTSTAAISTIGAAVFQDQGQQQVTKILNETPGIFTSPYVQGNGNPNNGASPGSIQTPQIRGGLPYETEQLIDGHPVSVGDTGFFSPTIVNPFLLQDVELVKGPGSMPEEINYGINGTINYRTLDPTPQTASSGMFSSDRWGGISVGYKATGETKDHKIGYAIGYVTDGAPGPLANFTYSASAIPLYGAAGYLPNAAGTIPAYTLKFGGNSYVIGGLPFGEGLPPANWQQYGVTEAFAEPLVGCCFQSDTGYHSTSELGKIAINFSNNTSLKLSYLGGQSTVGNGDASGTYDTSNVAGTGEPFMTFAPCGSPQGALTTNCGNAYTGAPYTGTTYTCSTSGPACGEAIPFDLTSVNGLGYSWTQQNLFQSEFRTTLGSTGTVLARYYTGTLNNYTSESASGGTNLAYTMQTWGAIPLCPAGVAYYNVATGCGGTGAQPTLTTLNGQDVTYSATSVGAYTSSNDEMNGETVEVQEQLGSNALTVAFDRSRQASSALVDEPSVGLISFAPAPGSDQTLQTISLRDTATLTQKLLLNVGDYFINYASHYSPDGGLTWGDSSHAYNEPRVAFTWQPTADTIYRFSTGGSVAPPYMGIMSGDALPSEWSTVIGGVPALGYILNVNNGDINAETAFAYDLGVDHRIARSTSVSADLYFTQLHNMFFPETELLTTAEATTYGCPAAGVYSCYLSKTVNLAQARYEGVELAVDHVPLFGFGWKVQGSLQRAYTYNLPPYFYCAQAGPGCTYDINLATIPNVNFGGQPTGLLLGESGVGSGRVPYALGYGELNWTGRYGQYYNLGLTYFGNNNFYNVPAFAVVSANVRFNIGNHATKLQLSADNLTGAYANPYPSYFGGIPLPLVKGATGVNALTGAPAPIYFSPTPQGNYGPTTLRIILTQDF
ncbi:MAG TPA: carboxypeptidase regulatory-like domain-containing protein [Candidatus Acidoferrales bacterium]|nr:carboxypeptidase regulatory-like domain-containing protein [Candidatus Acidoferrales bacterium]